MRDEQIRSEEFFYPDFNFKKSNSLINSRFTAGLLEQKLLAVSLAGAKATDDGVEAHFTAGQIRKLLNKDYKNFYTLLKRAGANLLDCKIIMENPSEHIWEGINIISKVRSVKGDFTVRFNNDIKNQILNLRTNYTTLSIETLSKFEKVSSFRLYETLRSRAFYPKTHIGIKDGKFRVEFTIAELRCLLGGIDLTHPRITELFQNVEDPDYEKIEAVAKKIHMEDVEKGKPKKDQYPAPKWATWDAMKRQTLDPAIEEICQMSDLYVEYQTTCEGSSHKITGVEFYITEKNSLKALEMPEHEELDIYELIDIVMELIEEKITVKDAKALLDVAGNDVEKIKKAYKIAGIAGPENLIGFMIKAIKDKYEIPVAAKQSKKSTNDNTYSHDYDFDELEKMLV